MAINIRPLLVILAGLFIALAINFEPTGSQIFFSMIILALVLTLFDKKISYEFEKPGNNKLISVGIAFLAYIGFILFSSVIARIGDFASTISFYSQSQSLLFAQLTKPAFANNAAIMFTNWGVLIPFAETILIIVIAEFMLNIKKLHYGSLTGRGAVFTWGLGLFLSAAFAAFHATAKGVQNDPALFMTFIFGLITYIIFITRKQAIEAVLFHVITNSIAVGISLGIGLSTPLLIGIILIVAYTGLTFVLPKLGVLKT